MPQSVTSKVSSLPLFTQRIVQSLTSTARYCQFTKKNPVAILIGISINVLYAFFDWLLGERKDRPDAARSLQTYWNALCLVRKQETGCHQINPLIKSQMYGVCQPSQGLSIG